MTATIKRWTSRAGRAETIALAPGPELEQACIRLLIGALVLVYIWWYASAITSASVLALRHVWFVAGFVAIAVAITLWVLIRPQDEPPRRILGIIVDNGAITCYMLLTGEAGAVVVGTCLFVVLGNGLRYGRVCLYISQATALLGFSIVLFASDFWSRHVTLGMGWLIALFVLPSYVGVLAERLKAERLKAEQELKECRAALKDCHEQKGPVP